MRRSFDVSLDLEDILVEFERIAKALKDPDAKPYQYIIKDFGWCINCRKVVEYRGKAGPEGAWEKCLNCREGRTGLEGKIILTGNGAPVSVQKELTRLHSRENQKRYFIELVKQTLQDIENEIKIKRNELKALKKGKENLSPLLLL